MVRGSRNFFKEIFCVFADVWLVRYSYVSLIRNSVTGPLLVDGKFTASPRGAPRGGGGERGKYPRAPS